MSNSTPWTIFGSHLITFFNSGHFIIANSLFHCSKMGQLTIYSESFIGLAPDSKSMTWKKLHFKQILKQIFLPNFQPFQKICFKMEDRQDMLNSINSFLDETVVLPPGDWDKKNLLSMSEIQVTFSVGYSRLSGLEIRRRGNWTACLKKCTQLFEYQYLLSLRDICWSKL